MKDMLKYTIPAIVALLVSVTSASAQSPADLNDLEIAHVAYTADNIDIRYAHLALAISENPKVREFAETMIRDHTAVNVRALALLQKLDVQPQDNFLSQALLKQADENVAAMQQRQLEYPQNVVLLDFIESQVLARVGTRDRPAQPIAELEFRTSCEDDRIESSTSSSRRYRNISQEAWLTSRMSPPGATK